MPLNEGVQREGSVTAMARPGAGGASFTAAGAGLSAWLLTIFLAALGVALLPRDARAAQGAPDPPRWVAARYFEQEKHVGLRWSLATGADAYRLWRREAREREERLLATVAGLQYLDAAVEPGGLYRYRLQSVSGNETGSFSVEQTVQVPAAKVVGEIHAPIFRSVRLQAVEEQGRPTRYQAALRVQAVPGAIGYQLYRSQTSGTGFAPAGFHESTRFVDADLRLDQTYYYVATALDPTFKESPRSLEIAVRVRQESVEDVLVAGPRSFSAVLAWEVGNRVPLQRLLEPAGRADGPLRPRL